jgi:hypothetical protein
MFGTLYGANTTRNISEIPTRFCSLKIGNRSKGTENLFAYI